MIGYRKSDVTVRDGKPAVNIKVYRVDPTADEWTELQDEFGTNFTAEWIADHLSDERLNDWFWAACEGEFEYIQGFADEVLHERVKVYQDGRSGGWAVVESLPDIEEWDAVALARWAKFERWCHSVRDNMAYQIHSLIGMNVFERAAEQYAAALAGQTIDL